MATTILELIQSAAKRGKAWEIPFNAIDPTGADDHFLHIANTGPRSLAAVKMEVSSTVAGNLEPFRASGSGTSGTNVPPISLSGPGGANPKGTFETGVDLQLTNDEVLGYFYLIADTPRPLEFYYIIPPNTAIGFNWEISTGILSGQVTIIELAPDEDPVS